MANDGVITCVEAKTGQEVWTKRLDGAFSASPIHAAGRIYFFDPEDNRVEIYYTTGYKTSPPVNQHIDLGKDSNEDLMALAGSFPQEVVAV